MAKTLTARQLVKLIREEKAKFGKGEDLEKAAKKTKEVEPDGYADTLEKKVNFLKNLKEEENRLLRRLRELHNKKRNILKDL